MKKVWRFVRRWWWAFLVAVAAVAGAVATALLRPKRPTNSDPLTPPQPTFREVAEKQVERVRLEGEVEKARITATADAQRERIQEIEAKGQDDPKAARAELAEWLRNNM